MADNFGLKIGIEGEKKFKKALSEITQSFKAVSYTHLRSTGPSPPLWGLTVRSAAATIRELRFMTAGAFCLFEEGR